MSIMCDFMRGWMIWNMLPLASSLATMGPVYDPPVPVYVALSLPPGATQRLEDRLAAVSDPESASQRRSPSQ